MRIEDLAIIIRKMNCLCFRILDTNKNELYTFSDSKNINDTIKELENTVPLFEPYGWIIVQGGYIAPHTRGKDGIQFVPQYKWDVYVKKDKKGEILQAPVPVQSMSNELLEAKVALAQLQEKIKFDAKIAELEKKIENNEKPNPLGYLPVIKEVLGILNGKPMSNTLAGPETNVLSLSDVDNKDTLDKQVAQINTLLEQISLQVPLSKIIILLQALKDDTSLVDTAISLLKK